MRWFRSFKSRAILAFLFTLQLVRRVLFFWKNSSGLDRFLNQYLSDGIFPVSSRERQGFPSYQRCQACSLCTFSCTAIKEGRAPSGFEPKFIMLGLTRSSDESEYFLEEWVPCLECDTCRIECPNDVPIHAAAEQIREWRNRLAFRSKK